MLLNRIDLDGSDKGACVTMGGAKKKEKRREERKKERKKERKEDREWRRMEMNKRLVPRRKQGEKGQKEEDRRCREWHADRRGAKMKHPPETNLPGRNDGCNHLITKWPDINSHLARPICHLETQLSPEIFDYNLVLAKTSRPVLSNLTWFGV